MDKIFEILGIERLDESKQTELKETLKTIIDLKAEELSEAKVQEKLDESKEVLKEEYEAKFAEYRDGLTSKFSNFVDSVLDEEMIIPESVLKFAAQGELYSELIEQFKTRLAIDEGMISGEVRSMLKEAKEEIESLREKLDEAKGQTLELESDASEMAAQLYIAEKCEGLTASQKKHVINLIGGELVKENIDKRFDVIKNTIGLIKESDDEDKDDSDDDEGKEKTYEMECQDCGNKETIKEEKSEMECSECGGKMKPFVKEGVAEPDNKDDKSLNEDEDKSPWEAHKAMWLNSMKAE